MSGGRKWWGTNENQRSVEVLGTPLDIVHVMLSFPPLVYRKEVRTRITTRGGFEERSESLLEAMSIQRPATHAT